MLVDLQTERALHVSLRAGDQKRQGNYRVKDAMEISVKELMPFFFFFWRVLKAYLDSKTP